MSLELKRLRPAKIPEAIEKAERYRLLNEPSQAESICRDVLAVEPGNHRALIILLLALTDQFGKGVQPSAAWEVVPGLPGGYERMYYSGIIREREAKAQIKLGFPGAVHTAYEALHEAMGFYERAEAAAEPHNDDPILRWNTCARFLNSHPEVRPRPEERAEPVLGE